MREAAGSMGRTARLRGVGLAYPLCALVGIVVLWWALTLIFDVPPFLLPPPDAVAGQLLANPELYARNALFTLEKVVYGGSVGVVCGFCLALGIAYLPWFRRAVYPYLVTARVLPKIAVAPLFLIYLGTGMGTAVVFVALIAFFPIVLSTAAGLQKAPSEYHDLLDSVDAGSVRKITHIDLPYALPDIFAGLKQSVTLAVVGAVVAEWIVADNGLGFVILLGSENVRADIMLAALLVLVIEGLLLYGVVVLAQRSARRWSAVE